MSRTLARFALSVLLAAMIAACTAPSAMRAGADASAPPAQRRVIVFVWDGMRPDSITQEATPNLAALAKRGTFFSDNHSSYPTLTMMNAAAFATGAFSGASGFFGNTLYSPGAPARSAAGKDVDLDDPVFTEDYGILRQLDANQDNHLLLVDTLFQVAQRAGLKTAAIGKSGPAFLQDYKNGGIAIDENGAFPLEFAQRLQAAHVKLPAYAPLAYPQGALALAEDNGDPTLQPPAVMMADAVTADASDRSGALAAASNRYLMSVFLDYVLPREQPVLSVVWLRNPDSSEHSYGVGSPNHHLALREQDELLGRLQARLAELGLDATTDLIVVSDHGHSNVSGPLDLFPTRRIEHGKAGTIDGEAGYSVSGQIRLAHELTRAGIRAFDGGGCMYAPTMSGTLADGSRLLPDRAASAETCPNYSRAAFTTPAYRLPHPFLPRDAFVVASNGGSDYLYQPAHDVERVRAAVRFLQGREEFGAIFVDARYGDIPGTLPLSIVRLENAEGRNPDIVVGYAFDENAVIRGMPGIEFAGVSARSDRGTHGSFSPRDVRNTLIASGPDFRLAFTDPLPSGNVDVAPTIAYLLGLQMPQAAGRPLLEALRARGGVSIDAYAVAPRSLAPAAPAAGLTILSPLGRRTGKSSYTFEVRVKELRYRDRAYTYFDSAQAVRN
jgi:predicted AlkP superfamily pyrophosphatase or phosphodiesterase